MSSPDTERDSDLVAEAAEIAAARTTRARNISLVKVLVKAGVALERDGDYVAQVSPF
jgi:hypothetical protein